MNIRCIALTVCPICFALFACGESAVDPPEELTPHALSVTEGTSQTDTVAQKLPTPIRVQAVTASGTGVSGIEVTFRVNDEGSFDPTSVTTNASGFAESSWTLGTVAGTQDATISAPGVADVSVTANAVPDAPASLEIEPDSVVLDRWADTASASVLVVDQYANVITEAPVAWSSSDTGVVRVDSVGMLTSWEAGEATVTAEAADGAAGAYRSMTFGAAGADARTEVQVSVELQRNAACSVPTDFPVRPPVGSEVLTWEFVPDAFGRAELTYEGGNAVANADFDGDGDEDLLVGDFTASTPDPERVRFWRNVGGTFEDATNAFLDPDSVPEDGTRKFEIADFNGDELPDVFRAQHGYDAEPFPGAANVLLLSQDGSAMQDVSSADLRPNDPGGFTHTSAALDIDCDGDPDLFTSDIGGSNAPPLAHLYVNDASGALDAEDWRLPAELADGSLVALSAASCDLDRDGDEDLVLGRWGSSNPEQDHDLILVNDGFGAFRRVPASVPPSHYGSTNSPGDIACDDLDLDGWPDVIVGNASGNLNDVSTHLNVWMNKGGLVFEEVSVPQRAETDLNSLRRVIDVNGDGWPDIVRLPTISAVEAILLNLGEWMFVPVDEPREGGFLVDADGDGRLDVMWPGCNSSGCSSPPELYLQR